MTTLPQSRRRARQGAATPEREQPTRVALYGRTSSEEQAEQGTIEAQQHFLRNFVQYHPDQEYTLVREYWDDGISGTIPLGHRPQGRQLLDDMRAGLIDLILITRIDRLARGL